MNINGDKRSKMSQSIEQYDNGYYEKQLERGLQFQDYVCEMLYHFGIVVVSYSSRHYQNRVGENMIGIEIKRDGNFRQTGNLYIETEEKAHPKKPSYVPAGIHRGDNSWLFAIGDEKTLYIFSIKMLRMVEELGKFRVPPASPTSKGFLIPIKEAEKLCLMKIHEGKRWVGLEYTTIDKAIEEDALYQAELF